MNGLKNNGFTYSDIILKKHQNKCILEFYREVYPKTDLSIWLFRMKNRQIFVNHVVTEDNVKLKNGDLLQYKRDPWIEPDVPDKLDILYEDEHILVVDKPSGLPVLPCAFYLENTLLNLGKVKYGKSFAPVHRLDRGTSGIVMCGKTVLGRKHLGKEMQQKKVLKTYFAIIEGELKNDNFEIVTKIGFEDYKALGKVACISNQGKNAITKILSTKTNFEKTLSLVKILLCTGRTHQIRIHLAYIGHPLLGETFYDVGGIPKKSASECDFINDATPGDGGFVLHASSVEFADLENKWLKIESRLPSTFKVFEEE